MKKIALLTFMVSAALTTGVHAQMSEPQAAALKTLNQSLLQNGIAPATPLVELQDYMSSKVKTDLLPVTINQSKYLLADNGNTITDLSSTTFVSADGFISGTDLLTNMTMEKTDLTAFPSHNVPEGTTQKAELIVFTDPTCVYCEKVDMELKEYLNAGVKVTYIPFPRGGLQKGSPGYDQWVRAYCTDTPAQAYHEMIMGKSMSEFPAPTAEAEAQCSAGVAKGYNLGASIGVRGTPYIILSKPGSNNTNIAGYIPAADLLKKSDLVM